MRNEKAIENIRAVMEQQELDWLKENGYEPVLHTPERRSVLPRTPSSKLAASRFLGDAMPAPEVESVPDDSVESPTAGRLPETQPEEPKEPEEPQEPEIVNVLPQKSNKHSWLYNEVVKAIHDAAAGTTAKVVAIIIPVVQNGQEFHDLPADVSIELPPVNEEDFTEDIDLTEDIMPETEQIPLEEITPPQEEVTESDFAEDDISESGSVASPIAGRLEIPASEDIAVNEDVASEEDLSSDDSGIEISEEMPAEPESEPEPESIDLVGDLLPEPEREPDPELAEAFSTIEEKLDDSISAISAESQEADEEEEKNEPSELAEIELPAELNDDEIETEA